MRSRTRADQISFFRLETRAREFMGVARIRLRAVNEAKAISPQLLCSEGQRVKVREVTPVTRETSRSWRGQGEAGRKLGGGPKGF